MGMSNRSSTLVFVIPASTAQIYRRFFARAAFI